MDSAVRFPFKINLVPAARKLYEEFDKAGYELYLVGGAVRDSLMGREAGGDLDFTTNATPPQMQKLFAKTIPTGIEHGTLIVRVDGNSFEVTTYRKDGPYFDSRKPSEVFFAETLAEDLTRRDFTINAFAYDIATEEVIDLFSGREDLEKKCIRTIGKAEERFREDALRMMRGCRFVAQLDFTCHADCLEGIRHSAHKIKLISAERIRDELIKLLLGKVAVKGIETMREGGLLEHVLPKVMEMKGVWQNSFHAYDVYDHTLAVLREVTEYRNQLPLDHPLKQDVTLPLASLLHDIAKPETKVESPEKKDFASFHKHEVIGAAHTQTILKKLRFPRREVERVALLVREHMLHSTHNWGDATVRRWLRRVGPEMVPLLLALVQADRLGRGETAWSKENNIIVREREELEGFRKRINAILKSQAALKISDLKIGGEDLMKTFKIEPGRFIGEILGHLLEKVLEEPGLNTREKLFAEARIFIKQSKSRPLNMDFGEGL